MPLTIPCPNLDELAQLAAGRLSEVQHAACERHVLNCARCQDLLAELDRDDDLFSELIDSVPPLPPDIDGDPDHLSLTAPDPAANHTAQDATRLFPEVLGGFRLLREIGHGGMGIVFEAVQLRLNRRVALKVLPFVNLLDPNRLKRFQNESRAAASLDHVNIVPVFDVGTDREIHYYAMLLIEGQNLAQAIHLLSIRKDLATDSNAPDSAEPQTPDRRFRASQTTVAFFSHGEAAHGLHGGTNIPTGSTEELLYSDRGASGTAPMRPLAKPFAECDPLEDDYIRLITRFGIDAAKALAYAHENGVIHRDIKPSNLMCDDTGRLWITDFGLARIESDAASTAGRPIQGTPRYMSPEQAFGHRGVVDHRTDVYSLGVTLYELLTLTPIFPDATPQALLHSIRYDEPKAPRQLNRNIPRDLETIILSAMSKEARDRYNTARDFADDLTRFLDHKPIRARRPAVTERMAKWVRRNPSSLPFAALLFIAVLAAAAGLFVHSNRVSALHRGLDRAYQDLAAEQANKQSLLEKVSSSELKSRQQIYALDLPNITRAVDDYDPRQALNLLVRHIPAEGLEDVRGFEWNLLWHRCMGNGFTVPVSDKPLYDVRLSPDGRYIAVSGADSIVRVWDATTWSLLWKVPTDQIEVNAVVFSPDGKTIATSGDDGSIQLIDFVKGRKRERIEKAHVTKVYGIAFTPDGKQIISGGEDFPVKIWNASTRTLEGELKGHSNQINQVLVSQSGLLVVSASSDGAAKVWKLEDRSLVQSLEPKGGRIVNAAMTADDKLIATATVDLKLHLFNIETGTAQFVAQLRDTAQAISFLDNGRQLAVTDRGGTFHLFALNSESPSQKDKRTSGNPSEGIGKRILSWQCHEGRGSTLAVAADGSRVISCGWDGKLRVLDVRQGIDDARIPVKLKGRPVAFQFSSNEELVYTAAQGEFGPAAKPSAWVQDPATGEVRQFENQTPWPLACATLSSDGNTIFFGHASGRISFRSTANSSRPTTWDLSSAAEVSEILATPDGKTIVAGLPVDDDSVRVYDFPSGRRRNQFPKTDGRYIVLSPDGYTLVFGFERVAYLWDLLAEDGNPRRIPGKESVRRAAFSRDGRLLALCGEDRLIRVFDVATLGEPLLKIAGHSAEILGVGFSPHGKMLISGDRAGIVKLWQVSTGRHILDLARVGESSFGRIEISPRGRYLAYSHYIPDESSIVVHDLQKLRLETFVENAP